MDEQNVLVGKVVTGVFLAEDGHAIKFEVEDGKPIIARTDGDCCSHTWIENVEGASSLINSQVRKVEETYYRASDDNELKEYGCNIISFGGTCSIDYRNESNGYYGGNLVWPGDSYFYGGVFDQNVSKEVWNRLA
jgi:hypothetical protein